MAASSKRSCSKFFAPLSNNTLSHAHTLIKSLCIVAAGVLSGICYAGQYYKWVDDKGITHFSEKPVVGTEAQKMGTSSKSAQEANEPEAPVAETPVTEGTAAPQASNDENCKIAQDRIKALQSGQRIRLVGPDGKFSYLDQNQIKEEMQKTQDVLKANCGKAAK
ncbi:MAG TPA: DUF4124 domain-containing protein [Cellvibrionaceae bacterium]